jgi:hypothetical protein
MVAKPEQIQPHKPTSAVNFLTARDAPGIGDKLQTSIVLPTRLTCCFPKGSMTSFLLETKMAVL